MKPAVKPKPPEDLRLLRDALGCFATGVTIVTGRTPEGMLLGFTANSFNSVSLDPPLVLFSLDRRATSLAGFKASTHFAVNVLAEGQRALSTRFANSAADKWNGVEYATWDSLCPILGGTLASFECRIQATHEGGDHVIFVGKVVHMAVDPAGRPLLYFRGAYGGLKD